MESPQAKLSYRQHHILEFIEEFVRDHGYPPTIREIGQAVGISSTSVVDYNLSSLERRGFLRRDREISRGIELVGNASVPSDSSVVHVPVVGLIAAGQPIEAIESSDDTLALSRDLVPDDAFALRVRGKSMIEDLIDDGDIVVVRPQANANDGDIVVALLTDSPNSEGQATLKRIYREKGRIRLQPANATMDPIFVRPDELAVQGRVVAVIRHLG
jgi:repressor LexA